MKLWADLGLRWSVAIGLVVGSGLVGCGGTQITPVVENLNGTCVNCHTGLTNPHPLGAAISCVDCHGGDSSQRPFQLAGPDVEALLAQADEEAIAAAQAAAEAQGLDPNAANIFIPVNPTKLADAQQGPFGQVNLTQVNGLPQVTINGQVQDIIASGRTSPAFQVLLTAAHALPKGCPGPIALDGSNVRVRAGDLNSAQDPNGADCHAVFFWPNGMDDDGDLLVDELGEYSMFNPTDPMGLNYEFDKLDANNNGVIEAAETQNLDLGKTKTFALDIPGVGNTQVPVKLGQNLDSEFNVDVNYVRWLNPGDVRSADGSCGGRSPASSFAGQCHDNEVKIVRRSIMSMMSGVLAGAIYANGAIPNARNLTNTDDVGFTDRPVQDLRDGRIAYLQNYDALDNAFDRELNRFSTISLDGVNTQDVNVNDENAITDLNDIWQRSKQNQIDLDKVFGIDFTDDVNSDDNQGALNTNGLEQDDLLDEVANGADLRGNMSFDSYPEALFRVDDAVIATAAAAGVGPNDPKVLKATTQNGEFTVESGADTFSNRRPGNRLIWKQVRLQDKSRSLFVLAPIPRRTLTGQNVTFAANADIVSAVVTGQDVLARFLLAGNPPERAIDAATGVFDDRQFSRGGGINPVDTALQTFRPFHSLSYPNITGDFFFFDEFQFLDGNANNDVFVLRNNPHARGRGTGCTSCHMLYDVDGVNREVGDPTVRNNGKQPGDIVLGRSPLVDQINGSTPLGFRTGSLAGDFNENAGAQATFNIDQDEAANWAQIRQLVADGLGVAPEELPRLQFPTGMDDFGRERFYPSIHKLTTQIPSKQCEYCHAFVTRVGFAAFGRHENEGTFDFTNWYTWSPQDLDGDGLITHEANDANNNGFNDGNAEMELGQYMNNRALAPGEDFLEFKNAVDPTQVVRIFNNLPAFQAPGGANPQFINFGNRFPEDLNGNGLLDGSENAGDIAAGAAQDLTDRPARDQVIDGRQQRSVYGGASGAVLLQDIHLQRGMHCIDCHFLQDSHGDGNVYARNWDAVEIECRDCHGDMDKSGTLVTSGSNGGHDLTLSKDQFGVAFFEIGGRGERIQRSRVIPGRQWRIPQVLDSITPGSTEFNPEAAEAMAVLNSANENAHFETNVDIAGVERGGAGKLECSSCHSSWTPNCMTCHMDFDHAQSNGEIWATQNRNPIAFFQLFTIVRAPFVLAQAGSNDRNKIMTHRSLMELHPNVTLNNGDALVENFTFSTARGLSGVAMNQYMAHTVRPKETKDCDSCHSVSPQNNAQLQAAAANGSEVFDEVLNDNILSQTLGLGSGRLNEGGDFAFAASSVGAEALDLKGESRRAVDADGDGIAANNAASNHSTFQGFRGQGFGSGFLVANQADPDSLVRTALDINRSYSSAGQTGASRDIVFLRNYIDPTELDPNSGLFVGRVRALDIVVLTNNNNLDIRLVTDRTAAGPTLGDLTGGAANGANLDGNITAIDSVAPDMSDPYIYAVTENGQFAVIDLRNQIAEIVIASLGLGIPGGTDGFDRAGFNGQVVAAQADVGTNLRDVEMMGNFAVVLDQEAAGSTLRIIDARAPQYLDREVTPVGSQFKQIAVDFLLVKPGTLAEVGSAALTFNGQTCVDPKRVALRNIMAYVACGADGVFVVNMEDPLEPRVIANLRDSAELNAQTGQSALVAGGLNDANGVYLADNRLFVANGQGAGANTGVVVVDVTSPKNPTPVRTIRKVAGALTMVDPADITSFVVPGQMWLLVSDNVGRAHAVNVTEAYNIRVRLGEHAADARLGSGEEAAGSVPGFRPQVQVEPFKALGGAVAAPRAFFEDTNVRFTLDLRDPTTPNDPAQIDEILQHAANNNNKLHIVSFDLAGNGAANDIRFAQLHDLDILADWSGFPLRDAWASAVNLNVNGCTTNADGSLASENCASDNVNEPGEFGARPLTGPRFNGGVIERGLMDVMRGVFVREENGVDLDGNGLGNLLCEGVVTRNAQGSVNGVDACKYPDGVIEEIAKFRENNKRSASLGQKGQAQASLR